MFSPNSFETCYMYICKCAIWLLAIQEKCRNFSPRKATVFIIYRYTISYLNITKTAIGITFRNFRIMFVLLFPNCILAIPFLVQIAFTKQLTLKFMYDNLDLCQVSIKFDHVKHGAVLRKWTLNYFTVENFKQTIELMLNSWIFRR